VFTVGGGSSLPEKRAGALIALGKLPRDPRMMEIRQTPFVF
jgi:hypothetical protein